MGRRREGVATTTMRSWMYAAGVSRWRVVWMILVRARARARGGGVGVAWARVDGESWARAVGEGLRR